MSVEDYGIVKLNWITRERADRLVVLVHGLGGPKSLAAVVSEVAQIWPAADLMIVEIPLSKISNADPFRLAANLEELIHERFENRRREDKSYEDIVLVGHSAGGALIRKVYLYGMGAMEDHPDFAFIGQPERDWARKVERLVLLAPLTRGWSIFPKPRHMSRLRWLWDLIRYMLVANLPFSRNS